MLAQAIDLRFAVDEKTAQNLYMHVRDDFDKKGALFHLLWDKGCRGFGSYDTFLHLDTTKAELYSPFKAKRTTSYRGQRFARWNKMKNLRYRRPIMNFVPNEMGQMEVRENQQDANILTEALNTASGVIRGYLAEIMDAEDRGLDMDFSNGLNLILAIIGILILSLLTGLLLFKPN